MARKRKRRSALPARAAAAAGFVVVTAAACLVLVAIFGRYTISYRSPVEVRFRWPLVIERKVESDLVDRAVKDQSGRKLTAYQQYACEKFGPDCRVALAIQRAENTPGKCEIYNYNHNGTLDWGYFQINTVHLTRPDVRLRDLLDCKANIDFAYRLFQERGFSAWSTYNNGAYRRYLQD